MARSLTAKQRQVLDVIRMFQVEKGYSPSVRQIGESIDLSAASVQAHLVALDRKGYLKRTGEAHGLTTLENPDERLPVRVAQIIGSIAAGSPIEAVTDYEGYLPLPEEITPDDPGNFYALKVRGDSMLDDHILDGDYVIVRAQTTANDGDVVVAILDDEAATLKRFYRFGPSGYRLQPANSQMEPIYTNRLEIRGLVLGVYRGHLKSVRPS